MDCIISRCEVSNPFDPSPQPWLLCGVRPHAQVRRRRRHVGGYAGTGTAADTTAAAPTGYCSSAELHRQPKRVTPCEGVEERRLLVRVAGRTVNAERYSWLPVCLLRLAPTIGAVADRANNLAPESRLWLLAGKDRRLYPELRPPPSLPTRATASQQSMSCMKHLIEAERESSVPSSNLK